ncbi:hypothetical protein [Streptomyces inhibens]|uniref:hypothetical protein n=1 Tax=Streptomyces inhibens TaxID=2293571 RepID=UPI001EE6BF46|nr:hypothetical protein [Streptomyces inhibens]UKY54687.1 hypothetical protein KI385_41770 [Streptomyces inhibens]
MLPVGVLTPMADGLQISPGRAGFSLSITGLVTTVTTPVASRVVGALERRVVPPAATVVLAGGNGLTTVANGFGLLVVSRVVIRIGGNGVGLGVRGRYAGRGSPPPVSFAVGGVAAASVTGVPWARSSVTPLGGVPRLPHCPLPPSPPGCC